MKQSNDMAQLNSVNIQYNKQSYRKSLQKLVHNCNVNKTMLLSIPAQGFDNITKKSRLSAVLEQYQSVTAKQQQPYLLFLLMFPICISYVPYVAQLVASVISIHVPAFLIHTASLILH